MSSTPKKRASRPPADLRKRAEAQLTGLTKTQTGGRYSEADVQRLVQELEVHRVELELQNEELRMSRRETEAGLERYTELFDFAPIGYVTLSADEVVREMNHAAARMTGQPRAQLIGRPFEQLVGLTDRTRVSAVLGRALESEGTESCEASLLGNLGRPFPVHVTAKALQRSDRKILVAVENITERKAKADKLERAEWELRENDRRKDEFIATLSHELRNPLTPVRNSLFILSRVEAGSVDALHAHEVIERQVDHLTRLVDDLLDVTRIARGRVFLRKEVLDFAALARRTVEDHRATFEAGGLALDASGEPGPFWIDGDGARLIQIISNLLGNARKFTPPGGSVSVTVSREGSNVALGVRDTGVGVPREELTRMFQPFVQGAQRLDRSHGGLGLGLPTVKGLVELHGGTVHAASEGEGLGTEVTLSLPLVDAPGVRKTPLPPSGPVRVRRVLVIEDSPDTAETLKAALSLGGHHVATACDGPRGLELARVFKPEVVICDIGLPGMSGYEVAREFRSDDRLRAAYLVALSGYAQLEDRRRAILAGFDQHVAKPPTLEALERLLAEAPERRQSNAGGGRDLPS